MMFDDKYMFDDEWFCLINVKSLLTYRPMLQSHLMLNLC
jgi:hypothetical protein